MNEQEFLTGNDKKSQQIYWSNLTPQCVRNVKTIIEHIEYEDFDRELAEVGTWKADDGEFKAVKADDNFYGVGWERKGSRGKFSGGEDNLMGWHDLVWPKKPENDPLLVLQDTGKGENPRPVRMQLKDGEEGTKKKKKPAAKPKLGQSKRGRLVGGQPGTWGFWTAPEDRNLRDWILSAQGDGFGA
jgi:hypothetical protein